MNQKFLAYSLAGILTSGAVVGLLLGRSQAGQSLPPSGKSQPPRSMRVDQHFIEMMIPHHQDAIAMADLASSRAKRPEVKQLAAAIKQTQTSEIQTMRTWYKQWYGKEVPSSAMPDMGSLGGHHDPAQGTASGTMGQGTMGMGQGTMGMGQGMMNMKTDLNALKQASDFDQEFVRQMIPHHQMAVKMAQMAAGQAVHPEIRTLAQSIITAQSAEIGQMQRWQKAW